MSIGFAGLHMLLPSLASIPRSPDTRILLLGTQDLMFSYDDAVSFFKANGMAVEPVPEAERRTTSSFAYVAHEDWWKFKDYLHHETLFRLLGFAAHQVRTIDVDDYEHSDILHDLNLPLNQSMGEFDFILNQGTLEHIFDIKQALWNLSDLTRVGGQIVHMAPAGFLNHGFYNINAGLFADYYKQSSWTEEELFYALTPHNTHKGKDLYGRMAPDKLTFIPENFFLIVVGRFRKTDGSQNPIAVQNLYLGLHEAWNHQSRDQSTLTAPPGAVQVEAAGIFSRVTKGLDHVTSSVRLRRIGAQAIEVAIK